MDSTLVCLYAMTGQQCGLRLHCRGLWLFTGEMFAGVRRGLNVAAPESRLDWFQNPTVNKGLGAGLVTIALAGVGAGIGIVWLIPIAAGYACPIAFGRGSGQRSLLADEGLMPANHFSDQPRGLRLCA